MDIRKIKKLIELLEESDVSEIEIVEGEESVRIARGTAVSSVPVAAPAPVQAAPVAAPPASISASAPDTSSSEDLLPPGTIMESPMGWHLLPLLVTHGQGRFRKWAKASTREIPSASSRR